MNLPPKCDKRGCDRGAIWHILNKTTGAHSEACHDHASRFLVIGSTHIVYPSRDYSRGIKLLEAEKMETWEFRGREKTSED